MPAFDKCWRTFANSAQPPIAQLMRQDIVRRGDLLHLRMSLDCFDGLLQLVKLAQNARPAMRKEGENDLLSEIALHVHNHLRPHREHM